MKTSQTTTTLYIGGVEKVTHPDGRREVRRYIDGLVIETKKHSADGTAAITDEQYTLKDHLGSIDVITNAVGAVVQELSFDPWGQRRNATNWQGMSEIDRLAFDADRTKRGFTGHEHLDEVGIIHMNGRIYDPKLARFLQADPFVQFPSHAQSHNRYSYALNNPLNATDPTGFFFKKIFKKAKKALGKVFGKINDLLGDFAPIVAIAINIWLPGVTAIWGAAANSLGAFLASGFIAGGIRTGTFKGAVAGAFDARARFNGVGGGSSPQACSSCVSRLVGADPAPNKGDTPWYQKNWVWDVLEDIVMSGTSSGDANNHANGAESDAYRKAIGVNEEFKDEHQYWEDHFKRAGGSITKTENSIRYQAKDGASVLVVNDVSRNGIPDVSGRQISDMLAVSVEAERRQVRIISGYRGPDHSHPSTAHRDYGAIDFTIKGYDSKKAARAAYRSGRFMRVAYYPGKRAAHADYWNRGPEHNHGLFKNTPKGWKHVED